MALVVVIEREKARARRRCSIDGAKLHRSRPRSGRGRSNPGQETVFFSSRCSINSKGNLKEDLRF